MSELRERGEGGEEMKPSTISYVTTVIILLVCLSASEYLVENGFITSHSISWLLGFFSCFAVITTGLLISVRAVKK